MKKRVSIYIEEGVWEDLKGRAWEAKKSASSYLEGLITGLKAPPNDVAILEKNIEQRDDEIEAANAKLMENRKKIAELKSSGMDLRTQYKMSHPTQMCPQCRERNRDCKC